MLDVGNTNRIEERKIMIDSPGLVH